MRRDARERDAARGPHGEHRRHGAGRRPLGRDGAAQAARAGLRPEERRQRLWLAPLPPVAADDLVGIGRTNDAILYGGEVTLWVRDDDARLAEIGPQVPSCASRDYGEPFAAIFERYGRDFYKIDPLLFSPAVVTLVNLTSGKSHRFGELRPDVLARSFSFLNPDSRTLPPHALRRPRRSRKLVRPRPGPRGGGRA